MPTRRAALSWLVFALAGGAFGRAQAPQRPLATGALKAIKTQENARVALAQGRIEGLRSALNLDLRHGFQLQNAQTDAFGQTHARFQQSFKGVPVWGAVAIHHLDAEGADLPLTDALHRDIEVDTKALLAAPEILAIVDGDLKPKGGYANEPKATLVIYPELSRQVRPGREGRANAADVEVKVSRFVLAYHVQTELENSADGIRHTGYMVDANSGAILRKWNSLQTTADTGVGRSQYSGTVSVSTNKLPNGTWEFRDLTRGTLPHPITGLVGNAVHDYSHGASNNYSNLGAIYTDADNTWGDGANYINGGPTTNDNGQTAAVDAAFGLQKTWDYYLNIHGRLGIDGYGKSTLLRLHTGTQYNNAFWSDSCFCMSYGDGTGSANGGFDTLTAIDVAGHEMSHGVTATSAALVYADESGALNEANSDIHGTMVEFYATSSNPSQIGDTGGNWMIGEQLGGGTPLRWMYRPDSDGASPNYWYPGIGNLDVHLSSGPMNRAFAFLSHGATTTDDWSTSVNQPMPGVSNANFLPAGMTGIGNDKAAAIWFRALTTYLTPNSGYFEARKASEQAAIDLFGAGSPELAAVQNAFAGINVGGIAGTVADVSAPTSVVASVSGGPTGTLTFTATASDNVGVTHVDFYVDGVNLGSGTFAGGQWTLAYESVALFNYAHTLVAKAYDAYENETASAGVVFNTANPSYQPLRNGGFEAGLDNWNPAQSVRISNSPVHGGSNALMLGGFGQPRYGQVVNLFTVPVNATSMTITYWLRVDSTNPVSTNVDRGGVVITNSSGGGLYGVHSFDATTNTSGWVQRTYTLSATRLNAQRGRTIGIAFWAQEDAADATTFLVDDVVVDFGQPALTDSVPPAVTSSSVTGGSGNITFAATATDDVAVARVDFLVDGTVAASAAAAPYTVSYDSVLLGNGPHTFQARAVDTAGNAALGATSPFTVSNVRPAGVFLEVESNNTIRTANLIVPTVTAIQGTMSSGKDVDYFGFSLVPGQTLMLDMMGPGGADYDLDLLDASSTRIAASGGPSATEHLSYTNNTSQTIPVYARVLPYANASATVPYFLMPSYTMDTTVPTVTASVGGTNPDFVFTATAADPGGRVAKVDFYVDGLLRGTATAAPYTLAFSGSSLSSGLHALLVRATDMAGNVGVSTSVSFSTATAADATITAASSIPRGLPGNVASVPAQAGASYAWTVTGGTLVGAADGPSISYDAGTGDTLTLSVTVTNSLGAVTGSKVVALTAANKALEITATVKRSDAGFTFTASSPTPLARVDYYVDGQAAGAATTGPDYTLAYDSKALRDGVHTLVAKGIDVMGNEGSSAAVSFTTASAPDATITASSALPRGFKGNTASVPVQTGATYAWTIEGGAFTGSATGSTVSFDASDDAAVKLVKLSVTVTNALNVSATGKKDINLTAINVDLDQDASADLLDLGVFVKAYGARRGDEKYNAAADLNGDGIVDEADIALFLKTLGN